ncbi:hypothetical protein [Peribacillus frigoritolerans]|uniref:hypothetical protein n=1 Tax=Peribacillus frigoritolerans TaxID=450367 RepID=UPI000FDC7191|nr:hypothetical protein [Peribacillus frigoritolerans]AZV63413.1 hypothetical protein DOZ91_24650 [Peribacillus frigoritolerans]
MVIILALCIPVMAIVTVFFHVESITIRFAMANGNVAQEQLSGRDEILAQSKVKQYIAPDRRNPSKHRKVNVNGIEFT